MGVTATGVLHYLPIVVSMLDPTVATDIELLKWLRTPLFLFCLRVISQFSIVFERPFLKASHKFGNTTADAYGTWLEGITSLVDTIFQLPSLLLLPPNQQTIQPPPTTPILTELESSICGTMAWSLQHIVSKHLLSLSLAGPGTLRSNNRYGETVFKYLRDLFQRNQHTRMVYAEAYVRVKRSSYTPHIIDNPDLLSAVRETARRRFEEKDLTFKSFAKYKLTELLKRRVKAMESQEKRDREGNLLAFLQSDDLVSGSVEKLTVEVLKGAVVTWQQSNPHISDLLRRNGTKEALMRQFEELYGQ